MNRTFLRSLVSVTLILTGFSLHLSGQTVDAGPDDTICPPGCATLTATVGAAVGLNGTSLTLSDDQWSGVVPLGFTFTFFGNNYTNIVVGSNNILTFDLTQAGGYCQWPISTGIPSPSNPVNSIMCPWEDLYPPAGGTEVYTTTGTAPNRIFIVSYCSTPMYSCTNLLFTGSVMLYETTNVIEMHTANKYVCSWNSSAGIHGIQDATGSTAFVVPGRNYPSVYTLTNDGYRFTPTGPNTYSMAPIPYAPIILNAPATAVSWTDLNTGWSVGTGTSVTVCPNTTTSYVATLASCAGAAYDTVTVVVNTLTVDAGVDDTICPGQSVQLNATGSNPVNTWSWSPTTGLNNPNIANPIASPTITTTYTVTGTMGTGCTSSDDITIVVDPSAIQYTFSQTNTSCSSTCDGTATVNVTSSNGPFTYTWSPSGGSAATATGLCPGTYSCTIAAPLGCSSTQVFTITSPTALTASISTVPSDCNATNGTATASPSGGTGPYTYSWTDGQTTQTASGLAAGIIGVQVTDANGCTQSGTVNVATATSPVATLTASSTAIILGQTSNLTASGGNQYQWTPTTGLSDSTIANPVATPQQTTTYCVLVTDTAVGCSDSTCITINVEIPCTSGGLDKLMPNAFSPNFDGVNDRYCIPPNVCIVHFNLKIYDRWGELVFSTTDMSDCWDGTFKGKELNTGVYAFYMDAELSNGNEYHQQGNISLVK